MIDDWMIDELEGGRFCGWAKSIEDVILVLFLGVFGKKERARSLKISLLLSILSGLCPAYKLLVVHKLHHFFLFWKL